MKDSNTPRGLLLTPFSEEFRSLRPLIADALQKSGIEPILVEETTESEAPIAGNLLRAIERADLVIADLTGSNPNVMYEVGFAHALRKPVLLMVQRKEGNVPSAIGGRLFLVYDPSNLEKLRNDVQLGANWYLSERKGAQVHA